MTEKKDQFTLDSQKNARLRGEYDDLAANVGKCVFCDLKEKYIVEEYNGLVLTVNIFPYITGHLMIIPKRHIESFKDVTQEEMLAYQHLTTNGLQLLEKKLDITNFWLLLREGNKAGKTVTHLHWQVMPYEEGIVKWNYKEIDIAPLELAQRLRGEI